MGSQGPISLNHTHPQTPAHTYGHVGTVTPLDDVATVTPPAQNPARWASRRRHYPFQAVRTLRFDLPSDCRDNQSLRYDALGRHWAVRNIKMRDKASGLMFLRTRPIGDGKIKTSENSAQRACWS